MSSLNCCFLTRIQVSQEAGQMVWYSHLFKNFPQFVVIYPVNGFSIVNGTEVDVFFWNSLAFSRIQQLLAIWSLVPLPFLNPPCTSGSSWFTYYWSLAWRILNITLHVKWVQLYGSLNILWHCSSLGLQWKLNFSRPLATAELSKLLACWVQHFNSHHLLGFEIAQLEFHHLHQLCS